MIKKNHSIKNIWEPNWLNSVLEYCSEAGIDVKLEHIHKDTIILNATDKNVKEFKRILNSADC